MTDTTEELKEGVWTREASLHTNELQQLHRILLHKRKIEEEVFGKGTVASSSRLRDLKKRKFGDAATSTKANAMLDQLLLADGSLPESDQAASYAGELVRRRLISRSCKHTITEPDTRSGSDDASRPCVCESTISGDLSTPSRSIESGQDRQLDPTAITALWKDVQTAVKASSTLTVRTIDMLRRCVAHSPVSAPLAFNGDRSVISILSHSLRSKSRSLRLAANELALAYQNRLLQQREASIEEEWMARFAQIPRMYEALLNEDGVSSCHETALIGLARLFDLPVESCQETCLLTLILHLGHSNPFIKACAYTQIVQIAAAHRCTTFQLVQKHFERVSTSIVERFISMPDLWTSFLSLIKMNQATFFNLTKEYTLPHLITMICTGSGTAEVGTKMIELIARALGTDVPRLCHDNITPIFRSFFMRSATLRDLGLSTLVRLIGVDAASLKALLRSRQSDVVGYLVVKLGNKATEKRPMRVSSSSSRLSTVQQPRLDPKIRSCASQRWRHSSRARSLLFSPGSIRSCRANTDEGLQPTLPSRCAVSALSSRSLVRLSVL